MKRGFTLIELLVVISIIAFLSAIALATLNVARTKAAEAKIISDFHQIQNALEFSYDEVGGYPQEYEISNPGFIISTYDISTIKNAVSSKYIAQLPKSGGGVTYKYSVVANTSTTYHTCGTDLTRTYVISVTTPQPMTKLKQLTLHFNGSVIPMANTYCLSNY